MNRRGQSLLLVIIFIPLLVLASGAIVRSGRLMLEHNRIQSHCDKKILDTLMWQARGLEQLGSLNPYARTVIISRRMIDSMLVPSVLAPPVFASLVQARLTLLKIQTLINLAQKAITLKNIGRAAGVAHEAVPRDFFGKIKESISPSLPFVPHATPQALILHVEKERGFEHETGAPLELDSDFSRRQQEILTIKIFSERLLEKWWPLQSANNMTLKCQARIEMNSLEAPWQAVLF